MGAQDDSDALLPFVFEHASVRAALIRLSRTSREILACHPYPAPLARALAETVAASALLSSPLKLDGSLVVQLSGGGPVSLIVVECDDALHVRATARWNEALVAELGADASLCALAGGPSHGRLTLTLDSRTTGGPYQGIVSLDTTSIAASIEHYLQTSEQLPSRLWLRADESSVFGLLLQRLPESAASDDAAWFRIADEADAAWNRALGAPTFTSALRTLFPHDDLRMFAPRPVTFRCKCSLARVARALRIAGRDEVDAAVAERGVVEVTCDFCNRRYTFAPDEARALIASPPPSSPVARP
ncbi:MAG TPA: Hsp33 family molecular chaperone HslO [Casimicrobiaceae bacterium]|nr:Hsp33 family molecular chaperone HslO [Casimicrobiaceae bacterium]